MDSTRNGGWFNASVMTNDKTATTSPFATKNMYRTAENSTGNFG